MNRKQQLKTHLYLMAATIILTFLFLCEDRSFVQILLFLFFGLHCILIVKWQSIPFIIANFQKQTNQNQIYDFQSRIDKSTINQSQKLRKTNDVRAATKLTNTLFKKYEQGQQLQYEKGKTKTIKQVIMSERVNNIKNGGQINRQAKTNTFEMNNYFRKNHQKIFIKKEMKQLQDKFFGTLKKYKIKEQNHLRTIQTIKKIMAKQIINLVQRHEDNLVNLSEHMLNVFQIKINQYTVIKDKESGNLYLDDIMNAYEQIQKLQRIPWKWPQNFTSDHKLHSYKILIKLLKQRKQIDQFCYFRNPNELKKYRMKIMDRLKCIAFELDPHNQPMKQLKQQKQLQQIRDQILLSAFFRQLVKKQLKKDNKLKVQYVSQQYSKKMQNNQIYFTMTERDSGIIHFNIKCNNNYYNCLPNEDNFFSALYFYILEVSLLDAALYRQSSVITALVMNIR